MKKHLFFRLFFFFLRIASRYLTFERYGESRYACAYVRGGKKVLDTLPAAKKPHARKKHKKRFVLLNVRLKNAWPDVN